MFPNSFNNKHRHNHRSYRNLTMFSWPLLHSVVTRNPSCHPPVSSECPWAPASPASFLFHLHRCSSQHRPPRTFASVPTAPNAVPVSLLTRGMDHSRASVQWCFSQSTFPSFHGLTSRPVSPGPPTLTHHLPKWHFLDVFRRFLTSVTLQMLFCLYRSFPGGWAPTQTRVLS